MINKREFKLKSYFIPLFALIILLIILFGAISYFKQAPILSPAEHNATRYIDRTNVYTNKPVNITLEFKFGSNDNAYGAIETKPANAILLSKGSFDELVGDQLKFATQSDTLLSGRVNKSYLLNFTSPGTYALLGIYTIGQDTQANTFGQNQIIVTSCTPLFEVCDNLDNNCDYSVDEEPAASASCGGANICSGGACVCNSSY
jgi:hypothetical protein